MDDVSLKELGKAAVFLRDFLQEIEEAIDACRSVRPVQDDEVQVTVSALIEVIERTEYLANAIQEAAMMPTLSARVIH